MATQPLCVHTPAYSYPCVLGLLGLPLSWVATQPLCAHSPASSGCVTIPIVASKMTLPSLQYVNRQYVDRQYVDRPLYTGTSSFRSGLTRLCCIVFAVPHSRYARDPALVANADGLVSNAEVSCQVSA